MEVTNEAAFGDIGDLFLKKKTTCSGGTVKYTLDTVRQFIPGKYLLHSPAPQAQIVHHESVSPTKISDYLLNSDTGAKFELPNYINRYDWMHYRNWRSIEKQLCDRQRLKQFNMQVPKKYWHQCFFINSNFDVSKPFSVLDGQLVSDEDKIVFGYVFDIARDGDWNYGCVFQDQSSQKYFAFVMEDLYTNNYRSSEIPNRVNCCAKDQYIFKMDDFCN